MGKWAGEAKKNTGWLKFLGILTILVGVLAIASPFIAGLTGVLLADRESVEELRRLLRERAELKSANPYLELLLRTTGRGGGQPPGDTGGGSAES